MQIAFVVYDGLTALDLIGSLEVLSRLPAAEVSLVATGLTTSTTDTGALRLRPDRPVSEVPAPDVIVVPGGVEGTCRAMGDETLLSWLRQAAEHARWVTSVCTGSHVLGAAGLLEGKRATSHWLVLDELTQHGATPEAERFVIDGNVATAAGVSAGIDLALWLAADLAGEEVAQLIQLMIEYDPQPPFDAGTPAKAGAALVERGKAVLLGAARRETQDSAP